MYGLSSASVNAGVCRSVNGHHPAIFFFHLIRLKNLNLVGRSDWAISILTSDTDYQLQLPCPEYLRLKRLQNSVRISAEVIQEKLQKNHVRYKAAMVINLS